jgi:uroporphyrinogen-III decarboxylase
MTAIEPFEGQADKERIIAAIRGEKTDRVPNFEILIEDQHVEKLLGRQAGNTLGVGGEPAKGSKEAEGVRPMLAKDYLELCQVIGQDAIAMEAFWTPIKTTGEDNSIKLLNDRSFNSKDDLERVIWPDENDVEERLQYVREYVQAAKGTNVGVILCGACIFQTLYEFVIGLHDCLIMVLQNQDLFNELMQKSADHFEKLIRCAVKEGIDILFLADDFAYNKGLFVRPDVFERLWRPHFERLVAPAKEAGIPVIFHSDGKIDEAMEMLIDMGIHCVTPMDPSGIDYKDYKKRYGDRVTLHGNIDVRWPLSSGTCADVEKDVLNHMEILKPGGRWIAGSCHSIVNFVPHENFVAMINAFHKYGMY